MSDKPKTRRAYIGLEVELHSCIDIGDEQAAIARIYDALVDLFDPAFRSDIVITIAEETLDKEGPSIGCCLP